MATNPSVICLLFLDNLNARVSNLTGSTDPLFSYVPDKRTAALNHPTKGRLPLPQSLSNCFHSVQAQPEQAEQYTRGLAQFAQEVLTHPVTPMHFMTHLQVECYFTRNKVYPFGFVASERRVSFRSHYGFSQFPACLVERILFITGETTPEEVDDLLQDCLAFYDKGLL